MDELSKERSHYVLSQLKPAHFPKKHDIQRLDSVLNFISRNFRSPIRESVVAQKILMNSSTFSRFFKQKMGKTFFSYLNEIRVEEACLLLMRPKAVITDVCFQSGFNNLSIFNRHFLRVKGMSPGRFRDIFGKP